MLCRPKWFLAEKKRPVLKSMSARPMTAVPEVRLLLTVYASECAVHTLDSPLSGRRLDGRRRLISRGRSSHA